MKKKSNLSLALFYFQRAKYLSSFVRFVFLYCFIFLLVGSGCKKETSIVPSKKRSISRTTVQKTPTQVLPLEPCPLKDKKAKECGYWRRCSSNAKACYQVGLIYESGLGDKLLPDPKKSLPYFARGCRLKHGDSCLRLIYKKEERSGGKMTKEIQADFEKACLYKSGAACARVSQSFLHNPKHPQPKKSFDYAKKACLLGHPDSCSNVGEQLMQGREFVTRDPKKAYIYFSLSCRIGYTRGCVLAGEAMLLTAKNRADFVKIHKFFADACQAIPPIPRGCGRLGAFYEKGRIVKRNLRKAYRLFKLGCRAKIGFACYKEALFRLRGIGGAKKNRSIALRLMKDACANGSAKACLFMADSLRGKGERQKALIRDYQGKACGFFDNASCLRLGRIYLKNNNIELARDFFQQACWGGIKKACAMVAKLPKPKSASVVMPLPRSHFVVPKELIPRNAPPVFPPHAGIQKPVLPDYPPIPESEYPKFQKRK